VKGYVEGDTLRFNLAGNDYAITCTLLLDGNLEVVWRNKNEALRSTFTRWNNPSWETSTPMNQEESNLAREQHRMNIETDIAEVYPDYSGEIRQFFLEEAINAGLRKIRTLQPSDKTLTGDTVGVYGVKDCAYGFWR
jgi:hypothetical protein